MSPKTTSEWEKEFDEKFVAKFYDDYGKIIKEQFKFYNIKTNKFFELEKRRVEIIQAEKNMLKRIKELNTITFDRIKRLENFLEVKYSENEKSKHIKKAK